MAGMSALAIAAMVSGGVAVGTGVASLVQSKAQKKLDLATIEANKEQAKLAASEQALQNAKGFRQALASQLALANFRGGPGSSIAAQFGAQSMSNFGEDQRAIERGMKGIDTAAMLQKANARMASNARTLGIISNAANQALAMANFSKMGAGGGGAGANAPVNPQSFRG